jgi:hypothetical protein
MLERCISSNIHKLIIRIKVGITIILASTSGSSSAERAAIESGRIIQTNFDLTSFNTVKTDISTTS